MAGERPPGLPIPATQSGRSQRKTFAQAAAASASFRSIARRPLDAGSNSGGSARGAKTEGSIHAWERSLHQLLFALTDRTASGPKSSVLLLVFLPVVLDLTDFCQLIALTLNVGWDTRVTEWVLNLSAFFHVNWFGGWTVFAITFWAVVAAISLMLVLAAFAAYSFKRNSVRILPIRIVRLLATVFQTALYIPSLQILTQELAVVGNTPSSALWQGAGKRPGWEWALYASASIVSLVLFVPFMLLISLVYVDTSPTSRSVDSCAHGRVAFLYTVVRTVLVFCVRFLSPTAMAGVLAALLGATFVALFALLPFYRKNPLMGGLFLSACFCAVSSLVLERVTSPDARFALSAALLAGAAPVFLLGWWLTARRTRSLLLKGRSIASEGLPPLATGDLAAILFPAVAAANEREGGGGPGAGPRSGASFRWPRRSNGATRSSRRMVAPASISSTDPEAPAASGGSGHGNNPASRLAPLSAPDRDGTATPQPSTAQEGVPPQGFPVISTLIHVFRALRQRALAFWMPYEVEVATRFIAYDHSDEALDDAEAVYQAGYTLFPDSAYVRLAHAVFLAIHRGNPMSALQVHRQAWGCRPAFDVRFALEAMKRDFEQRTASTNLGEDGVDYIAILEYRRLHDVATKSHNEAIARLRGLWRSLARTRLGEAALAGLPRRLESVDQASRTAAEAYRSLLAKFPNSKLLLREYGAFLDDIANEPELARVHFAAADEIEEQQTAEAGDQGSAGGSFNGGHSYSKKIAARHKRTAGTYAASASGSSSSSDFAARARLEQQRAKTASDVRHVRRVRVGIIVGLFAIAVLCAVFFVVIQQVLLNLSRSVHRIVAASSQMRRLVEFSFMSRSMNLHAYSGQAEELAGERDDLAATVDLFSRDLRGLYLGFAEAGVPASSSAAAIGLWNDPNVELVRYVEGNPPARLIEKTSLWVASSYLAGMSANIGTTVTEALRNITAVEPFHFVQDNAPLGMLGYASRSVRLYEDEIYSSTGTSKALIGSILAITVAVMIFIGVFVFRPAFEKVRRSMRGVNELVLALPPPVRKAMHNKYAKMRRIDDVAEEEAQVVTPRGEDDTADEPASDSGDEGRGAGAKVEGPGAVPAPPVRLRFELGGDPPSAPPSAGHSPPASSPPEPPKRPVLSEARLALAADEIAQARAAGAARPPPLPADDSSCPPSQRSEADRLLRVTVYPIATPENASTPLDASESKPHGAGEGAGVVVSLDPLHAPPPAADPMESVYSTLAEGAASFRATGFLRREPAPEDEKKGGAAAEPAPHGPPRATSPQLQDGDAPRRSSLTKRGGEEGGGDAVARRASAVSAATDNSEGHEKGEEGGGEGRGATSDIVSALTRRYIAAFIVIALIAAANFAMCFVLLDETQYVAGYIREAGFRWEKVTEVHHWAREAAVNDGITLSLPDILVKLHSALRQLSDSQRALVQGNVTMSMPPALARYQAQDRLLFEEKCLRDDPADCLAADISDPARVQSGLDFLMQSIVNSGLTVLQEFGFFADGKIDGARLAAMAADPPTPLYDYPTIRAANPGVEQILELDEGGYIDESLTRSMAIYRQMADERVRGVLNAEIAVLVAEIVLLAALYAFVFRSVVQRLRTECNRTQQFVGMIPAKVLMQVPALHKYAQGDSKEDA